MAKLSPVPKFRALDANGDPLAGGKLYAYIAGTTTPKDTFTTEAGDVANTNPVILDSDGYADVWLESGSYKLVLRDSDDVLIYTVDNIAGSTSNAFSSAVITQATSLNVTSVYNNNTFICTASLTLSLLAASEADDGFFINVKNTSGSDVTIDPDGAELIDGASTLTITDGDSAIIVCNGTTWFSLFLKGTVGTSDIEDNAVTLAKIQQVATATFLGRATSGTGNVEVVTPTTAVAILSGGGNIDTGDVASNTTAGIIRIATDAEVTTGTSETLAVNPKQLAENSGITLETEQATTSGTSIDFSSIPSGVDRITVMINGISTNGTSSLLVQIGDSATPVTTGYTGATTVMVGTNTIVALSSGFRIYFGSVDTAAAVRHGSMVLKRISGNKWECDGIHGLSNTTAQNILAGTISLSGELDIVRLTTVNGTDTFDAGTVNISYE